MNERDSEIMGQLLGESSYTPVSTPNDADVIVVNTCSIRGKAAQKAYSSLGLYKKIKKKKPDLLIAVTGCVAQQDGNNLIKRMPYIDLVLGPQSIYRLPMLLESLRHENRNHVVSTELSPSFVIPPFLPDIDSGPPCRRFVTIMQGCDNFCTYCVVPYTRGREISRNFHDIISEIDHLAAHGVKEITLLGQNVNSYGRDRQGNQFHSFPGLLKAVAEINGIERLRFTTSHPKDLTEELMHCFAEIEKLCPHFHLPVQSGSNRILKSMNRNYTIESYLEKVRLLRRINPAISLTTDLIVGFPGESDEDFGQTVDLLREIRYDSAYSFKYSDRPQAKSSSFDDKVEESVKSERLARLQKIQDEITHQRNIEFVGRVMNVMAEGKSKTAGNQWTGRTGTNHVVNFYGEDEVQPGELLDVLIEEALGNSLRGRIINKHERSQ